MWKMSRIIPAKPFLLCYMTEVTSVIRGHHVYKEVWDATIGEMLEAASDKREEAREYDKYGRWLVQKRSSRWTHPHRNFKFMLPFHQSRSREQDKSSNNWQTSMGNRTCCSSKTYLHDEK